MEINASQVKQLREMTGLPMMDCKKALTDATGDFEKAIDLLRKSGAGKMEKLAGRETTQGRVAVFIDSAARRGGVIELRCETAPVANTEDFKRLVTFLAQATAGMDNPTPESVLEQPAPDGSGKLLNIWQEVVNKLRENMQLARVESLKGELGQYVHFDGQSAAVIELNGPCPDDLKSGVCMHVVSMKPPYLRRENVSPAAVARERDVLTAQVPPEKAKMADKIIDGKMNRWYGEMCLLEQPYVKDDKQTVGAALKAVSPTLTVNRFVRFKVGGA